MRIAVFILIISTLSAQGQAILDASSLNAIVNSNGKMFGAEGVKYPKSENKFSFGETMLWISGYHGADSFISANILNNNTSDFQAGPISDDGLSGSQDSKWNTVYAVSSHASFIHKNNFNKENYTTPNSILNWQANGESGFTNILAPFVDWNSNDIYEPTQGDYPYIYGDQMAYTVFNDRGVHGLTGGDGMGIQVENLVSVYGDNGNVYYRVKARP